jgi:putative transposase
MLVERAYRYRIYPTLEQQAELRKAFGCARFVRNQVLAEMNQAGKWLSYNEMCKRLTTLRQEHEWLNEVAAQMLQQSLKDLRRAITNYWEGRANRPHFKRRIVEQTCRYPQYFKLELKGKTNSLVYVQKVGWLKLRLHRKLAGNAKSVTVILEPSGKYYVSIQVKEDIQAPTYAGDEVGIDRGLHHLLTLSTGEKIDNPRWLKRSQKRLKRLQRRLSRRQKGSASWEQARQRLARQHEKVRNQRQDFYHKLSRRLVGENQALWLEDLNVTGMQHNHRLAASIADASWSTFERYLVYKGNWYGCRIEKVDRWYPSSQLCHRCAYRKTDLTLNVRRWMCPSCGTPHDRDLNAAINLVRYQTVETSYKVRREPS